MVHKSFHAHAKPTILFLVATSDDVKVGVSRLIFYPHESAIAVRIRIVDDKLVEGTEAFGVQLVVPDHHKVKGVKLGNPSLATVSIRDGMLSNYMSYLVTSTCVVVFIR